MYAKTLFKALSVFMIVSMLVLTGALTTLQKVAAAPDQSTGNPGAIWTTTGGCGTPQQDVNHFAHGNHVYINGAGFNPGDYAWSIKGQPGGASGDPDVTVASGTVHIGSSGSFCFDAYTVNNDDWGEYDTKVGTKGDNYRVDKEAASASVTPTCSFENGVTTTGVNLVLVGANLLINGNHYTTSGLVSLPVGHYHYSWVATSGYTGSGSGSVDVVDNCTPPTGSASVTATCSFENGVTTTGVNILVTGASVSINGGTYSSSGFVALPVSPYSWTWAATTGYQGSGSGSVDVVDNCTPKPGDMMVEGTCSYENGISYWTFTFTLNHAVVSFPGSEFPDITESGTTFKLPAGDDLYFAWKGTDGYTNSGEGVLVRSITCIPHNPPTPPAPKCPPDGPCTGAELIEVSSDGTNIVANGYADTRCRIIDGCLFGPHRLLFVNIKGDYAGANVVYYNFGFKVKVAMTLVGSGPDSFYTAEIPWRAPGHWHIELADGKVLDLPIVQTWSCCFNYLSGIDTVDGKLTIRGGICTEGIANQIVRDYGWTFSEAYHWVVTNFNEPLRVGDTAPWPPTK